MNDFSTLLNLPTETLAVLGAGYIGYSIACTGRNQTYRAFDIIFISLAYGLFAKLAWMATEEYGLIVQIVSAVFASFLAASLWRKWLYDLTFAALRKLGISHSDRFLTAWDRVKSSTRHLPGQLVVRKKSGTDLMCDNLPSVRSLPHGPCIYGSDGSVTLYVTHFKKPGTDDWVGIERTDKAYGSSLTYIPASEISEIEVRI